MPHLALRRFLRAHRGLEFETYRNQELLQLFIDNFPVLMRDAARCIAENRRPDNSIANFGLTIPVVWIADVYLLCSRIEHVARQIAKEFPKETVPYLVQVKEKWGDLRVYIDCAATATDLRCAEFLQQIYKEIETTEKKYRHED